MLVAFLHLANLLELGRLPLGAARANLSGEACLHDGEQEVRIERLRDDVHGAELACALEEIGVAGAPATGNGDDLRVRLGRAHLGKRLDAFLVRHDDVGDDEVRLPAAEHGHPVDRYVKPLTRPPNRQ
jgi:hypothetical protein